MKTNTLSAALAASLLLVIGVAIAANPHYVRGPDASLNKDGTLTVSWKHAGLGSNTMVDYLASADGHARYQCVNKGGKCPAAANKQDVAGPVTAGGTFSSGKNGSISGSLTIEPPASTLSCPGNQVSKLVSVSYENIALESSVGGVEVADPSSLGMSGSECP